MIDSKDIFWRGFDDELAKTAFPEQLAVAGQRAVHGLGRVGAEALSGVPTRIRQGGLKRGHTALEQQLELLNRMSLQSKAPKKGVFQSERSYQRDLDAWSKLQEMLSARKQAIQSQLPAFQDEVFRLEQHLDQLKAAPWTTPL